MLTLEESAVNANRLVPTPPSGGRHYGAQAPTLRRHMVEAGHGLLVPSVFNLAVIRVGGAQIIRPVKKAKCARAVYDVTVHRSSSPLDFSDRIHFSSPFVYLVIGPSFCTWGRCKCKYASDALTRGAGLAASAFCAQVRSNNDIPLDTCKKDGAAPTAPVLSSLSLLEQIERWKYTTNHRNKSIVD